MAAPSVRVRLVFDYPPPAIPESCMFWLLVDVKRCRVVTDLSSIIRERFFYGQRGGLSLYVDDCLLPPGESIQVIRDNDSIRVKWDDVYPEDDVETKNTNSAKKSKKRHRKNYEEDHEDYTEIKSKKQKTDVSSQQDFTSVSDHDTQTKKKKKSKKKSLVNNCSENEKSINNVQEDGVKKKHKKSKVAEEQTEGKQHRKSLPLTSSKAEIKGKRAKKSKSSSSDLSSSSLTDDHEAKTVQKSSKKHDKPAASVPVKKTVPPKANTNKASKGKKKESSSSSSDSDTSEEEGKKAPMSRNMAARDTPIVKGPTVQSQKKQQSDGSDSDTFVIKKPISTSLLSASIPPSVGNGKTLTSDMIQGPSPDPRGWGRGIGRGRGRGDESPWRGRGRGDESPWRGRGRGDESPWRGRGRGDESPWRGRGRGDESPWRGRGFRGRGDNGNVSRGRGEDNHFFYNYNTDTQKHQQLNEPATNSSVIIQNPPEIPKKDYSAHPLLAAPPQIGKTIAFKLLELTENYTPEVSDYKEGRILRYDAVNQQVGIEILSRQSATKEPGKFDLVYQMEDGRDVVEYAVTQDTRITQSWSSLIEPRLILDISSQETQQTVTTMS
ncbi:coilin [Discoglossus pictus]